MYRRSKPVEFLLLALLAGCGNGDPSTGACGWNGDGRPVVLHALECPADFDVLAGEAPSTALPASRSVLFLVDRRDDHRVHFFDSVQYRHFTYARDVLGGFPDLTAFNAEMYYQPGRRLLLGTLTHHLGPDILAVSMAPVDRASPEVIGELFAAVAEAVHFEADLRWHPSSNALEMPSRLPPGVPVVTTAEIYEGATYQGMHPGETVGRVRRIRLDDLDGTWVSQMDIVVVDRVPNDIPAVAGLVTGEFQTPLSHVNLLAAARGTPNMALLGAFDAPDFVDRDGRWVRLVVRADGYTLVDATADEADAFWAARRPSETQIPALDLSLSEFVNLDDVDASMTAAVGGKAANAGELRNIVPPLPVPDGFAIPCSFYVDFMQANGFDSDIEELIARPAFLEDGQYRMAALASLRERIRQAPVDAAVAAQVAERIAQQIGDGVSVRFRSSANAEDLAAFNGAGLYDSHTYHPDEPGSDSTFALRAVWASLWNAAAFEEREWARVDHLHCAMGVLVHRSFPDDIEAANGVAMTDNPFDPPPDGQAAYYVNVQAGAVSVTNPEPGVTAESFLYYKPPAGGGEMTVFSTSSLTDGEPVLSFDEIGTLVDALRAIHEHFQPLYGGEWPFAMDVEFKFELPARTLVIKQARPWRF